MMRRSLFGGEEAFRRTRELDRRKAAKCKKKAVKLIYARPGYDLDQLLEQVYDSCLERAMQV